MSNQAQNSNFLLEIITPERAAFSEQVDGVSVPGGMGQITALARHIPLFTTLKEGEIVIRQGDKDSYLAIGGGFMEVTNNKVLILVSRALHAHELNETEINKAHLAAKEILTKAKEGAELATAMSAVRRSTLELKVIRRRSHGRAIDTTSRIN